MHSNGYNPEKIADKEGIVTEEGLIVCVKNVPELIIKSKLGVIDVFYFHNICLAVMNQSIKIKYFVSIITHQIIL